MSQDITLLDGFCGAGGSSTGAVAAGAIVKVAINHWARAIETHSLNHPTTDHDIADLQQTPPSRYPHTDMLWMSPECFPAGTMVLTENGYMPIEEVEIGMYVLTHKNRWKKVVRTQHKRSSTVIVRGQGHSAGIEVTPNHRFYVRMQSRKWDNERRTYDVHVYGEPDWVAVEKLTDSKYRWATPTVFPEHGILEPDRNIPIGFGSGNSAWWLIGRWLGDGSLSFGKNSEVVISCGKTEVGELLAPLAGTHANWKQSVKRTAVNFSLWSRSLRDWLFENFGHGASHKSIPAWVLAMPTSCRQALLDGYISADGHTNSRRTRADSVSKALALSIRLLAESLGYRASLHLYQPHNFVIEGRTINSLPIWAIAWENNKSTRAAYEEEGHAWSLVKSISPGREDVTVYNIEVEEDHSYIVEGIVVANCTNHTSAKGRKRKNLGQLDLWGDDGVDPAEERSRATMREVVEFTAYHKYQIVIVENVVEIKFWQFYDHWIQAMVNLGYEYKTLYLNAMHFGVPQSRDRIYVVFWQKGNKKPELEFHPYGYCIDHGVVGGVQTWKRQDRQWGRYGKHGQYLYRCPHCGRAIEPFTLPASDIIDWSIPSVRIGDRKKPLKPKTTQRILEGLRKFQEPMVLDLAFGGDSTRYRTTEWPMMTQTSRQTISLVEPFILSYMNGETPARSIRDILYTIATHHTSPLIIPPSFLTEYYGRDNANSPMDMPAPTIPTANRLALISMLVSTNYYKQATPSVRAPLPTQVTKAQWGLLQPFISEMRGTSVGHVVEDPLSTMTRINHHALIDPFMVILKNSYSKDGKYTLPPRRLADVLTTLVASGSQHALVTPDRVMTPEEMINDCGFRMLEPLELKLGMSFPESYQITGVKRDQVKQVGDAVCPNVAEWIVGQCVRSLS